MDGLLSRRHQPLQLLEPIQNDVDLVGCLALDDPDQNESTAVRADIIVSGQKL